VNGATASSTDGITPRQENKKKAAAAAFFYFIFFHLKHGVRFYLMQAALPV
jgi:hypothetical protein